MNERGLKVLEQYDLKVLNIRRGRGSFIFETDRGLKLITEFSGSGNRLYFQNRILAYLKEQGYRQVDMIVENAEGKLVSLDKDETAYVVKDWFDGRECDTKNEEDILSATRNLAQIHLLMRMPEAEIEEQNIGVSLEEEYQRRNREIKKVYGFMRKRQRKNAFESCFLNHYPMFFEQALASAGSLEYSAYKEMRAHELQIGALCHGDYNQHHMLNTKKGMATTNFAKCRYDVQIGDLYQFLRKILEKQNWNPRLGLAILEEYDRICTLDKQKNENLRIRLAYPEKFWKLANHYYNHNKAWIPGKNVEKLKMMAEQQQKREAFLKILDL